MNKRNALNILRGFVVIMMCLIATLTACARIEAYFSHTNNLQLIILERINDAESSVDVAMYTFTDLILADALIEARDRGVEVRIYLDRSQVYARYSQSRYFVQNVMYTRISSNRYIMHNKFAIIDGELLITGSYNWTKAANNKNDENLIVIDCICVIKIYQEQFEKLWNQFSSALFEELIERSNNQL